MIAIIGIVVVFGAVIGGYLMEHGRLLVLVQPAELVIIGASAVGTVLIANPLHILKKIAAGIAGVFRQTAFTRERYLNLLKMMYELFNRFWCLRVLAVYRRVATKTPRHQATTADSLSWCLRVLVVYRRVATKTPSNQSAIRCIPCFMSAIFLQRWSAAFGVPIA